MKETIMKKSFCVMTALMGASLFLSGCQMEVEVEKLVPVPGPTTAINYDVAVDNLDDLKSALQDPAISVVGVFGEIVMTTYHDLTIPSGKTVSIHSGSALIIASSGELVVKGTVYVGYGSLLRVTNSASGYIQMSGGSVNVLYGGALVLHNALDIQTGGSGAVTSLGTSAVTIDGGTLVVEVLQDKAAINNAFASVKRGMLVVESLTDATSIMPSDITSIAVSETRMLAVTLITSPLGSPGKKETEPSLTIPEWLMLTVYGDDVLADVEEFQINGVLEVNTDLTISSGTTLNIAGELIMGYLDTLTIDKKVEIPEYGALTLMKDAKLTTTANGQAVFGKTTFEGEGTWTASASATGGEQPVGTSTSVSIVSFKEGALVAFNPHSGSTAVTGVLTASGTPVITQAVGQNNALIIWNNTVIDLAGTGADKAGQITLKKSITYSGTLTFYSDTSKILAGAGTGGTPINGITGPSIGEKSIIITGLKKDDFKNDGGKLVQLGGAHAGSISASPAANGDVVINSTVAASGNK
jgi:hypothetical protein